MGQQWAALGTGPLGSSSLGRCRDRDVSRRETGQEACSVLLGLYKQSISGSREHMTERRVRLGAGFTEPGPLNKGEARSQHVTDMFQVRFSPSFLPSLDRCTLGKRGKLDPFDATGH